MITVEFFAFQISVLSVLCLSFLSLGSDDFFINCGSSKNVTVDDRVFVPDEFYPDMLQTPTITANTTLNLSSFPSTNDSFLYETARIFTERSSYRFNIKSHGRHFIRLHFFGFDTKDYNLSSAKFSVSAQNFTLIKEYQPANSSVVKEYTLNITSDELVLSFTPSSGSIAFVNAMEVLALPVGLLPQEGTAVGPPGETVVLQRQAFETVFRINMGNLTVNRSNDKQRRLWVSDFDHLRHDNLGKFVSGIQKVDFSNSTVTDDIAPAYVYGTATKLNSEKDPNTMANVTWSFNVDPGFEYFVRLHFCDVVQKPNQPLVFNVYIGALSAINLDLAKVTNNVPGAPYFIDVITKVSRSQNLNVSVGSSGFSSYPDAILNGLEIMKLSNTKGSLDVMDAVFPKSSKPNVVLIAGLAVALFVALVSGLVLVLFCRRRRRLLNVVHSGADENFTVNGAGSSIQPFTKIGYRFPLAAVKEATDNFSESLVIGVGGFGKVYKGVLRDDTKVAVKRGAAQSSQGLAEFKTEIEMLSQFRHRHLVSLIGYCDEHNEMIIVYEYMENGTLKSHLYGSDHPSLSWRQRLEICIGAARGLHYLHTGSTKAIIHRDVKSANILLDENFMAKVADFGLSKTGPDLDHTHVSTAVKGSFGYLDPEYLTRQQLTEKSDVYSFGVVMFEVLCGRPVIDPSLPRERVNLIEWALKLLRQGKFEEIIDPFLVGQVKSESLNKYAEIAEKCLAENGVNRPAMGDVLWNLECALQLQGSGDKPKGGSFVYQTQASLSSSTAQFSMASVGDIAGVSMSKVFAQMVREDNMR